MFKRPVPDIFIVGRHQLREPLQGYQVVGQESITWDNDIPTLLRQWDALKRRVSGMGAKLVLQNVPTILTHALMRDAAMFPGRKLGIGLLITENIGTRVSNAQAEFETKRDCPICGVAYEFVAPMLDLAEFTNASSHVEIANDASRIRVTVDPRLKIKFLRIDWI
jgi:hypothetical protein